MKLTFREYYFVDNIFDVKYYNNNDIKVWETMLKSMSVNNDYNIDHYSINIKDHNDFRNGDNNLIIITFPYNGEPIIFLHLDYLYDYVDFFIIVEV